MGSRLTRGGALNNLSACISARYCTLEVPPLELDRHMVSGAGQHRAVLADAMPHRIYFGRLCCHRRFNFAVNIHRRLRCQRVDASTPVVS